MWQAWWPMCIDILPTWLIISRTHLFSFDFLICKHCFIANIPRRIYTLNCCHSFIFQYKHIYYIITAGKNLVKKRMNMEFLSSQTGRGQRYTWEKNITEKEVNVTTNNIYLPHSSRIRAATTHCSHGLPNRTERISIVQS